MKIALVLKPHDQAPEKSYGGCGRVVDVLVRQLVERGHQVTLYTAKESSLPCEVVQPVGVIEDRYDATISPYEWSGYVSAVADHINEVQKSDHPYDIVNNHYDPYFFQLARLHKFPRLTTIHGINYRGTDLAFGQYPDEPFSAVSNTQREQYSPQMNFQGIVHNAVNPSPYYSENKCQYLTSLSRIHPWKGQHLAIELAVKLNQDLVIMGNNMDTEYFNKKILPNLTDDISNNNTARENWLKNTSQYKTETQKKIIYFGEVYESERDKILAHSKALVFPVQVPESFGLVMIEVCAVGTPVLALKNGATTEVIEERVNGYTADTIQQLGEKFSQLDQISPQQCSQNILERFSPERLGKGYLETYQRVIGQYKTNQ